MWKDTMNTSCENSGNEIIRLASINDKYLIVICDKYCSKLLDLESAIRLLHLLKGGFEINIRED